MPASSAIDAPGRTFAEALSRKDVDAIGAILDPEVDFRGLTPNRAWEATGTGAVTEILGRWFEPSDEIRELVAVETGSVADRDRVTYRFRGENPDGPFEVEQTAYYTERDGRINWLRVLCSGFRPPR